MKIKVIGLDCSPRTNSNSYALLEHSMKSAKEKYGDTFEYKIISLRDNNIKACAACASCGKNKETCEYMDCIWEGKDDAQYIYNELIDADGIAVATPVYFGMPSDLFSKFIMRSRLYRHQDFQLANKPVGVMAIAGRRSGGAETAIMQTWLPFLRNGCLPVGNGDATCQYGAMAWAGPKGHVMSDEWGLEQGCQTIERIVEVAKLLKAGTEALNYTHPMKFSGTSGKRV